MNEEFEALKTITGRLDQAHLPYMVTGSMAMNYYAVPRMTRDIDLVIELAERDVPTIIALFEAEFYIDRESVREALRHHGMFNIIHNATLVKADFVIRKDTPYRQEEFRRRRRVSVDTHQFWIVALEDLILSKLDWAKDSHSGRFMTDTSPEMEQRYRALVMARSGGERLLMGCSLFTTAKMIVTASILERHPNLSERELRQAVFRRFYGREFNEASIVQIFATLDRAQTVAQRQP